VYAGGGMEPLLSSSPFFFNNNHRYGMRSAGSVAHGRLSFPCFFVYL
jgi:hypothetical protein